MDLLIFALTLLAVLRLMIDDPLVYGRHGESRRGRV